MNSVVTSESIKVNSSLLKGFTGLQIAIIPYPALGDTTIYLRLAWLFSCAGARVTIFSNAFHSARAYFPWLQFAPEQGDSLPELAARFDLVIACFEKYYHQKPWLSEYAALDNIAFVTAKKIARESGLDGRDVVVGGRRFCVASRAFCLDSDSGKSMVEWVDSYAADVFHLVACPMPRLVGQPLKTDVQRVLIFPTTPELKKNYWLAGFRWLADRLVKRGWQVEFVCMPDECGRLEGALPEYAVRSFSDISGLIDHVATASAVISNDSGGGHLASLMGITTFTISRRHRRFAWRPGFNQDNIVINPWFRFKALGGGHIWRPFIPVWRIIKEIDQRQCNHAVFSAECRTNRRNSPQ